MAAVRERVAVSPLLKRMVMRSRWAVAPLHPPQDPKAWPKCSARAPAIALRARQPLPPESPKLLVLLRLKPLA